MQDLKTISDLKENLSKIFKVATNSLWVVEIKMGVIYDDDRNFADLKKHQNTIEVVIGNSKRTVRESQLDVISDNLIESRSCKMSCDDQHVTSKIFCIRHFNPDKTHTFHLIKQFQTQGVKSSSPLRVSNIFNTFY